MKYEFVVCFLLLGFLIPCLGAGLGAQELGSLASPAEAPDPGSHLLKQGGNGGALFSSYWEWEPGGEVVLELTNNSPFDRSVTPTLAIEGKKLLELGRIDIPSLTTSQVSLASVLANDLQSRRWGSLELSGKTDGIIGWVTSRKPASGVSLQSRFLRQEMAAARLAAPWWRPATGGEIIFVLQNVGEDPVEVEGLRLGETGAASAAHRFSIPGRGSVRVTLAELAGATAAEGDRAQGGVVLFWAADSRSSLLGRTVLADSRTRLSMSAEMTAPDRRRSPVGHMAGGPGGTVGTRWGFDENSLFSTSLVLANVSAGEIEIQPTLYWSDGNGAAQSAPGETLRMKPWEARLIPPGEIHSQEPLPVDGFFSLELEHTGPANALVASGFTTDDALSFPFVCPLVDSDLIGTHKFAVSFDLGPEKTTLLILRNVSAEETQARYVLTYDQDGKPGQYYSHDFRLGPKELRVINLKEVRDLRLPGAKGEVLPPEIIRGSAIVGADEAVLLAADPTIDRMNRTVALCEEYCSEQPNPDGIPICSQSAGFGSIVRVHPSISFALIRNNANGDGTFDCKYTGCGVGLCRNGSFWARNRPFCYAGLDAMVFSSQWLIFVLCEVFPTAWLHYRPC